MQAHLGIAPDIIIIAKGLTSAYAPLSGSIVDDRVWKVPKQGTDAFGAIGHGWTYSAQWPASPISSWRMNSGWSGMRARSAPTSSRR